MQAPGGVLPIVNHMGRLRPKGVLFQVLGIFKGRDFMGRGRETCYYWVFKRGLLISQTDPLNS